MKFIILLHKVLYDYVTLFDVYECAINPDELEERIKNGEAGLAQDFVLITVEAFMAEEELETYPFERDTETGHMKALSSEDLISCLRERKVEFKIETDTTSTTVSTWAKDPEKRQQFEAVKRCFYQDWKRVEPRLRTSIVEGIPTGRSQPNSSDGTRTRPSVARVALPLRRVARLRHRRRKRPQRG